MNTKDKREEFWKVRAKNYEQLEWVIKGGYLHSFLDVGDFNSDDYVLDVGTGTGIIAHTISPFVHKVIGVDISADMLNHAYEQRTDNEDFKSADIRNLDFQDDFFTKITARMVFHHVLEDTQKGMEECFRVLRPGGKMIFSEGVPPSEHVKPFYKKMFRLKEQRITFMDSDLISLMRNSGFSNIEEHIYWMRRTSIRNWLTNSGLPQKTQDKIYKMHIELDDDGKRDYNMVIENNDCLIDMKFIILVGEKKEKEHEADNTDPVPQ